MFIGQSRDDLSSHLSLKGLGIFGQFSLNLHGSFSQFNVREGEKGARCQTWHVCP